MIRACATILVGIALTFALAAIFRPDAIAAFAGKPIHSGDHQ